MDAATVSLVELLLRCVTSEPQCKGIEIGFDWQTVLAISAQTAGAAEMLRRKVHRNN
jgi:hypothetical protein